MIDVAAIEENVARAKRVPGLEGLDQWWLTFAITGAEPALRRVAAVLAAEGAVNLEGAESGFLNVKIASPVDADLIAQRIAHVRQLASDAGAELFAVDGDSSPDVTMSAFCELWRA